MPYVDLKNAQHICDTTGQCSEYQTLLQQEYDQIDSYYNHNTQDATTYGAIVVIIGLIIILTPFIKPLRKLHSFLLPKLAIIAPIPIGLYIGVLFGFSFSFSECFKQSCSAAESSTILTIPLISLIITIPITIIAYKKRRTISTGIVSLKPKIWIIIGLIIIALAVTATINKVVENGRANELEKQSWLKSEP